MIGFIKRLIQTSRCFVCKKWLWPADTSVTEMRGLDEEGNVMMYVAVCEKCQPQFYEMSELAKAHRELIGKGEKDE
jgi:hypothetical protein